jgi:threonine synthase
MNYFSTNKKSAKADFREATIRGQAPDKGLYFPERIPTLSEGFTNSLKKLSKAEIAFEVMQPFVAGTIPDTDLRQICEHTVNFEFPLVQVTPQIYSLELFHGPTLAFKDVGARFMSRCLGYFSKNNDKKITVLVATSGDTGSAVANGFLGIDGVDVIILYPSGKVSAVQELQLTTLGKNITALEVKGTFDDCQQLVKQAFADSELTSRMFLTSANSINVARWLPQQCYYFFALQQWQKEQAPVVCVPSGNFGNICAGLLAWVEGMPAKHFIAACNINDTFSAYLQSGLFQGKIAHTTISNAMDVGNPSNFVRVLELFEHNYEKIKASLSGAVINDSETEETIKRVQQEYNYLLDPHGAVGFLSLERYLKDHPDQKGYFLETAHPVKFGDVVERVIGKSVPVPDAIQKLKGLKKKAMEIKGDYTQFKDYLMSRN